MSDDEYTPVPKRPDPAKENAANPESIPGGGKSAHSPNKDPDDMPKAERPRNNSQLHNTAKFNSEVTPEDYPEDERQASQLTGRPKK
ncbi:hypothetical protein [Croceicoccus hydrothermalis]|uniref:hypothetical protein n=1 Tax=Croceicoccus hydrothermalis TaxID=2867964 RepID=UPI001EFAB1AC|nr:hypothetical protein [Croceicoccus hydrothermalis]